MTIYNLIWDFDGTLYDTYPRIIDSFDKVINGKYGQKVSYKQLLKLVLIDTKYCANVLAEKTNIDAGSLLQEVRKYYDGNKDVYEGIFSKAKMILEELENIKHFIVTHRDKKSTY